MSGSHSGAQPTYLELLRREIALLQELGETRRARNDMHETEIEAWCAAPYMPEAGVPFEDDIVRQARWNVRDVELRRREQSILAEIDKLQALREHLRFAGLSDAA